MYDYISVIINKHNVMIEKPLASIIVLAYNQEKYIIQTLEGLLMQRTSFPYEIIIHDDASTDETSNIIRGYTSNYPNIIKPFFQHENKYSLYGINYLFEYVISKTSGKYVAMCAGDDYWIDPLKLQKQVEFLENNPDFGMVHTKAVVYVEEKIKFEGAHGYEVNDFESLITENSIATLTVCLRKSLFKGYIKEVNPKSQPKWKAEDFPTWLWFINHSKIKFLNDITCVYRKHEQSISHNKDEIKNLEFSEGIYAIVDYYLNKYPKLKSEKKIRARYYSNMTKMYFLNKRWDGIRKSTKVFYDANDWLNLLWIGLTLPFFYSRFIIRASYRIRSIVFSLLKIYPVRK